MLHEPERSGSTKTNPALAYRCGHLKANVGKCGRPGLRIPDQGDIGDAWPPLYAWAPSMGLQTLGANTVTGAATVFKPHSP